MSEAPAYSAKMAPALFKTLSAACKVVVEEATFAVSPEGLFFQAEATFAASPEGLFFQAMDPSHVELIHVFLPPAAFESFECGKPTKFSLRTEDLTNVAGRLEEDDKVTLAEGGDDTVAIRYEGKRLREFTLHQIEANSGESPLPKLDFPAKATLTAKILEKVLGDVSVVADQVTIRATPEGIVFAGRSDVGKAEVKLTKGDADLLNLECNEPEAKATFSVDYLAAFLKQVGGAAKADAVKAEFASKKPIRLTFTIGDQGGMAALYLVSRVSD